MLTLGTVLVRTKRDALLARQRARQVAALLRFEFQDQVCIAAGAFAVAAEMLRRCRSGRLLMQIENKTLHIFPCVNQNGRGAAFHENSGNAAPPESTLRLVKPLPAAAGDFADEDLLWLVRQLDQQMRFSPFDEIHHQNQEMLALLHALHSAQAEIERLKETETGPAAA